MKVAVVGMGAMGTLLAHGMILGGHSVTAIDRARRVEQIRSNGLIVVRSDGIEAHVDVERATDDLDGAGPHDVVILATKAHHLVDVGPFVTRLAVREAPVVSIQNGIPWWYFQGRAGVHGVTRLQSLDPKGILEHSIDSRSIVGCVAYPAASLDEEGCTHHIEGNYFPLGEIDGRERARTRQLVELLISAGFRSRVLDDIRSEIWLKAWGALSINPISALTRAPMSEICTDPGTRNLVGTMMREAQTIAETLGVTFRHTIDERIEGARLVGDHKTSMLQDLEHGETLELGALLGSVIELGSLLGHKTPAMDAVFACASLLGRRLQAQRGRDT